MIPFLKVKVTAIGSVQLKVLKKDLAAFINLMLFMCLQKWFKQSYANKGNPIALVIKSAIERETLVYTQAVNRRYIYLLCVAHLNEVHDSARSQGTVFNVALRGTEGRMTSKHLNVTQGTAHS